LALSAKRALNPQSRPGGRCNYGDSALSWHSRQAAGQSPRSQKGGDRESI